MSNKSIQSQTLPDIQARTPSINLESTTHELYSDYFKKVKGGFEKTELIFNQKKLKDNFDNLIKAGYQLQKTSEWTRDMRTVICRKSAELQSQKKTGVAASDLIDKCKSLEININNLTQEVFKKAAEKFIENCNKNYSIVITPNPENVEILQDENFNTDPQAKNDTNKTMNDIAKTAKNYKKNNIEFSFEDLGRLTIRQIIIENKRKKEQGTNSEGRGFIESLDDQVMQGASLHAPFILSALQRPYWKETSHEGLKDLSSKYTKLKSNADLWMLLLGFAMFIPVGGYGLSLFGSLIRGALSVGRVVSAGARVASPVITAVRLASAGSVAARAAAVISPSIQTIRVATATVRAASATARAAVSSASGGGLSSLELIGAGGGWKARQAAILAAMRTTGQRIGAGGG